MTLGFSLRFPNGKPTYFMDKIWKTYFDEIDLSEYIHGAPFRDEIGILQTDGDEEFDELNRKLHTIRKDKKDRWKAGSDIHMVVNNRTPERFQFMPVVKCTATETIEINWFTNSRRPGWKRARVKVNGRRIGSFIQEPDGQQRCNINVVTLALNDGFENAADFFDWFSEDFTGKIIHWTNLKYSNY